MPATQRSSIAVGRRSTSRALADAVAADIRSRSLIAGDRIGTQRELAARFGVAVATLREALRQLEAIGFVTIRHGSGIFVGPGFDRTVVASSVTSQASTARLLQLLGARCTIEPSIAEQAALVRDEQGLTFLRDTLEHSGALVGSEDENLWRINIDIHRAIAKTAGNPILEEVLDSILLPHAEDQRKILAIHGDPVEDFAEHEELVRLISDGRADDVRATMQTHLTDVAAVIAEAAPASGAGPAFVAIRTATPMSDSANS